MDITDLTGAVFSTIKLFSLSAVIILSMISDLKLSKIPNRVIAMGMAAGVAINAVYWILFHTPATEAGYTPLGEVIAGGTGAISGFGFGFGFGYGSASMPGFGVGVFVWLLLAILIPFVSLIGLYKLKMLGAGDVKLFMSVGAIIGPIPVVEVMAYSFLAGGAISFAVIILNGGGRLCVTRFLDYVKACFLQMRFLPYRDAIDDNIAITRFSKVVRSGGMVKFSVAAAAGGAAYAILTFFK